MHHQHNHPRTYTRLVDWHEIKQLYLKPRDLFWFTAKAVDNGFMTTRFIQKQVALENVRVAYFRAVWRRSSGTVPRTVGVLPSRLQRVCFAKYWAYIPNNWTYGSGNQGVEARLAPFPITLSNPLAKYVLCVPTWVGFWQISGLGSGGSGRKVDYSTKGHHKFHWTSKHNYCVVTLNFSCKWGRREDRIGVIRTTGFPQQKN